MILKFIFVAMALAIVISPQVKAVSVVNNKLMEVHPHGRPDTIIHFTESRLVVVDQDALAPLLKLNRTIGDYKVAVYSIVGASRQGKSFLMNYCLRYLYAHFKSINFTENTCADPYRWMNGPNEPLKGFSWRSGKMATTAGIVMWSDIFLHEGKNGEKTAIVIMDTQQLFDTHANMKDSAKILALSALFSSQLIFNIQSQIDEQQLKYLQLVSDYAQLIKETGEKEYKDYGYPLQNLLFLIRDWANYEDHPFGLTGGTDYVDDTLNPDGRYEENAETRGHIKNTYQNIKGFLMPYPGQKVAGAKSYDGSWSQMDGEFKNSLKELVEYLFSSENIQRKIVTGNTLTGLEHYNFISALYKIFSSGKIPDLPNIYDATIDKHMAVHKNEAIELYKKTMKLFEDGFTRFENDSHYEAKALAMHQQHKAEAIKFFKTEKKMGTPQIEEKYANELVQDIELIYENWSAIENLKRENLRNSEAYNRTIEEHRQQLVEEKKLRAEQEVLRKIEHDVFIQSKREMETDLMKQQAEMRAMMAELSERMKL